MAGLKLFSFTQQLLELSMRVRGARHEILSANIANADTPGYRPKDLDFKTLMRSAVDTEDTMPAGDREAQNDRAVGEVDIQSAIYEPSFPNDRQGEDRLDGNSVSLDRQMGTLTENSLAYEASLTLLSRTLANLRYVIGEGRR
jgi:flagellar basal-body rod protein FlgB